MKFLLLLARKPDSLVCYLQSVLTISYLDECGSVEDWELEEVLEWLTDVGLGQYCHVFRAHDIHGKELLALTKQDIRELGLVKLGHIKRFVTALEKLSMLMPDKKYIRRLSSHK